MKQPPVLAVVVAFNGGRLLDRCLQALLRSEYPRLEVLVVDNASSDASIDRVVARKGRALHLLRLSRNRGFAGGVNAGLSHARSIGFPLPCIYALVNQDCLVEPDWLGHFVSALSSDPGLGVVGARLLDLDGKRLQHAGGLVRANGLTEHLGRGMPAGADSFSSCLDVDYVTGALCAFRSDTWARIGPLDEGYCPLYYEEVDFCLRARRAGLSIRYIPQSVALHGEAASSVGGSRLFLDRYHRSRMRFVVRHLLRGSGALRALGAEIAWLGHRRSLAEILPALRAYRRLPRELLALYRERGREGRSIVPNNSERRAGRLPARK